MHRSGFIVSPVDIKELRCKVSTDICAHSICSSLSDINNLLHDTAIYFVISKQSMCSTAYQELVSAALDRIQLSSCKVLRLDAAEIPIGFEQLRHLPEAQPD